MLQRLRHAQSKITLDPSDLPTFSSAFSKIKRFSVSLFTALIADNCGCCRSDRSIKVYRSGQEQIDKRLDIVKLIRLSMDIELLKKLYLLPR